MPRDFVIYITWALQNLSLKRRMVSECGQGMLLNIMMASSKGAGGEMFCFSYSSCVLCIYCHKLFNSGRMLFPFLPWIRKQTWLEVFDTTAVAITNFSRLLPSLWFHVSWPDITASQPLHFLKHVKDLYKTFHSIFMIPMRRLLESNYDMP